MPESPEPKQRNSVTRTPEIEVTEECAHLTLLEAVDRARVDNRMTWVMCDGERIAAVVPVGVGVALDPDSTS